MSIRDLARRLIAIEHGAAARPTPRITAIVVHLSGGNPETLKQGTCLLGGRVIDYREVAVPLEVRGDEADRDDGEPT